MDTGFEGGQLLQLLFPFKMDLLFTLILSNMDMCHFENSIEPEHLASEDVIRPRGYQTFSCSTQLSTKFQLLIKTKIPTNKEISFLKYIRFCIYHANTC